MALVIVLASIAVLFYVALKVVAHWRQVVRVGPFFAFADAAIRPFYFRLQLFAAVWAVCDVFHV